MIELPVTQAKQRYPIPIICSLSHNRRIFSMFVFWHHQSTH